MGNKLLFATWAQATKAWQLFRDQKGNNIIPYEKILKEIIDGK